jgi:hypothetical protein
VLLGGGLAVGALTATFCNALGLTLSRSRPSWPRAWRAVVERLPQRMRR